ncbi:MAG: anthranilate phosphoribosyltransferase [Chthoniobacterales bacterium]
MKQWTEQLPARAEFTAAEVREIAADLLSASAGDEEKADFLEALNHRGETPGEVCAFASTFLDRAEPFEVPAGLGPVLDVCGTGGDKLGLFNVSTAVMFVAAGAGARLVKHGNRGVTSRSGGADVLEALGVPIEAPPETLARMLETAGAVFLFAPRFHPAFRAVAPARKILGGRGRASVFNMLGPLLNPARPAGQLTGVFSEQLLPVYADVLPRLGRERAWIVHGRAGEHGVMDEISTLGPTVVVEIGEGPSRRRFLQPEDLGFAPGNLADLRGGDAADNALLLERILGGVPGPARDLVLANAAAALIVAGLADEWSAAVARAAEAIDSGAAARVLSLMRQAAS